MSLTFITPCILCQVGYKTISLRQAPSRLCEVRIIFSEFVFHERKVVLDVLKFLLILLPLHSEIFCI